LKLFESNFEQNLLALFKESKEENISSVLLVRKDNPCDISLHISLIVSDLISISGDVSGMGATVDFSFGCKNVFDDCNDCDL
jgi:hypothetical protein